MKALINAGADVNALDSTKNSPLHWASAENPAVVPVLLEAGAKANLLNAAERSPLFIAALATFDRNVDNNSTVTALLAAGANPLLGTSPLKDCGVDQNMKDYIKSHCKCGEDEDDESNQRKCKKEQEEEENYDDDSYENYTDEDYTYEDEKDEDDTKEDKKDTNNKSGKKDSDKR